MRIIRTTAIVFLALAAAACSQQQPDLAEGVALVDFDESALSDLVEVYGGFAAASLVAVEDRVVECMASQGFDYFAATPSLPERDSSQVTRDGFISNAFGLGATEPASDSTQVADPRNEMYLAQLAEGELDAYNSALFGSQDGSSGCLAQARMAIVPDEKAEAEAQARAVIQEIAEAALQGPDVATRREEVYQCFDGFGLSIDSAELHPESGLTQQREEEWFGGAMSSEEALEDARIWAGRLWDCGYPEYLQALFAYRSEAEAEYLADNQGLIEAMAAG